MSQSANNSTPAPSENGERVKIYLLPNLFTAGNLACGFFALTWIFKYDAATQDFEPIRRAIWLILAAFAFDFFDGRVARVTRKESPFGREFDSLADIVSFGVAPAFLVYRIVLQEFVQTGWIVAAIYLICGGIRLARFNLLSQIGGRKAQKEFVGFPIPSAAALVVSVTMLMMSLQEHERELGNWRFALPVLMLILSWMMVSNVRYPTFKAVEWTLQKSVAAFALVAVLAVLLMANFEVTLAFLFVGYLLYGLVRPWISKRWRQEIEEEEPEDEP
ncbi:MAG: CDP-diacylglycerol--serine O-phosphatidyltransferase [Verrucomicrobiae bacterium]|nr:CDP-diacylglycerol--serine O-phosphatidyltransferase [Verrucomicrobiae bacterium]